jgi:hypothetical protein
MPSAFISYVKEDAEAVNRIATVLREFEVNVWLDKHSLKPGLRWQDQIRQGISGGDFFIACFSKAYVSRSETYMNEELTVATERLRKRARNRAWFIPVKLTACEIPDWDIGAGETLQSIQWVDIGADWTAGMESILSVIVPGSERIPRLLAQLDHESARRRVEAIEALGRIGPLARVAVPTLVRRIDTEESSPVGLCPLAAMHECLELLGVQDPTVYSRIQAAFCRWNLPRGFAGVAVMYYMGSRNDHEHENLETLIKQAQVLCHYARAQNGSDPVSEEVADFVRDWWTEVKKQVEFAVHSTRPTNPWDWGSHYYGSLDAFSQLDLFVFLRVRAARFESLTAFASSARDELNALKQYLADKDSARPIEA